jgi:hypothetical protein
MTFRVQHHNKILTILQSLNADVLEKGSAYFGDGTLISLDFGEYRLSQDVDFIAPAINAPDSPSGYRYLRSIIYDGGYSALFRDLSHLQIGRGTTDQYGIRMLVLVEGTPIKTEIIAEVRFKPSAPRYPSWSPVACLSLSDCFTSKLLANSDRYLDDSVGSRDLIDLAILRLQSAIPEESIQNAENAYEVIRPLQKAIARFQERKDYRNKCFSGLQIPIQQLPRIMEGIDLLANDFGLPPTERTFQEQLDIFQ